MDRKKILGIGKRALCLLLTVELFSSPVAMAYVGERVREERTEHVELAEGEKDQLSDRALPTAESMVPEERETSETTPAEEDPSAELLEEGRGFRYAIFGYGTPIYQTIKGQTDWAMAYLRAEIDEDTAQPLNPWDGEGGVGRRYSRPGYIMKAPMPNDGWRTSLGEYLFLPPAGRTPDMTFQGYYVYDVRSDLIGKSIDTYEGWYDDVVAEWTFDKMAAYNAKTDDEIAAMKLTPLAAASWPSGIDDRTVFNWPERDEDDQPLDAKYGQLVKLKRTYGDWNATIVDSSEMCWGDYLAIVGRWAPSDRAELTGLVLSTGSATEKAPAPAAYTTSITGRSKSVLETASDKLALTDGSGVPLAFDGENVEELWLRVDATQTTLDLTFETYEPYLEYLSAEWSVTDPTASRTMSSLTEDGCPVQVTATFGGEDLTTGALSGAVTPEAIYRNGYLTPTNSVNNPARAVWTIPDIKLQAANGTDLYNEIVITVTAPDKSTTKVYKLHVERLTNTGFQLNPGNTPYGMIESDTSARWDSTYAMVQEDQGPYADPNNVEVVRAENKAFAKAYFKENYAFHSVLYPQDSNHQLGNIYKGIYRNAWPTGSIYDHDETAIVVYQDSAFVDPGIRFTDSEGRAVKFGIHYAGYTDAVTRTIKLRQVDMLTTEDYDRNAGTDCWYVGGTARLSDTETAVIMEQEDGSDMVDLRGLNIRPGMYEIVYVFTDPISEKTQTARRPMVVLPIPGDVDMDGAVTVADALALELNVDYWMSEADPIVKLVKYRVFDVNHDNRVTGSSVANSDTSAICAGFQPKLVRVDDSLGSDYYYLPLPVPAEAADYHTRKTWSVVEQEVTTTAGRLTLQFLGVETGQRYSGGNTVNPCGPWAADRTLQVELPDPNQPSRPSGNDTFWMGVYLEPSSKMVGAVESFTIALSYDSRYVEPAAVYTAADVGEESGLSDEGKWKASLRKYNLSSYSETLWGTNRDYNFNSATVMSRAYDNSHYSKVISSLEQSHTQNGRLDNYLKEVVVSLEASGTMANIGTGYILAIPFRLIKQPYGLSNTSAQLVELSGGMRDFTIVTTKARSGQAGLFSTSTGMSTTQAYSAQEDIYGDATVNLRSEIRYNNTTQGMVPIGKNNSTVKELKNTATGHSGEEAEYDTYFKVTMSNTTVAMSDEQRAMLPPGLKYSAGIIDGIPIQAGDYEFTLGDSTYVIRVRPRTLRCYAANRQSYYGQGELRGYDNTRTDEENERQTYAFFYYPEDLADRDLKHYLSKPDTYTLTKEDRDNLDKTGEELAEVIGYAENYVIALPSAADITKSVTHEYEAPEFAAYDDIGKPVTNRSTAGRDYEIRPETELGLGGSASNYILDFIPYASEKDAYDGNRTGFLSILKRPVQVEYIVVNEPLEGVFVFHDQSEITVRDQIITDDAITEATATSWVELRVPGESQSWLDGKPFTGNAKVAGDQISLQLNVQFQFDPSKDNQLVEGGTDNRYHITGASETRNLKVAGLKGIVEAEEQPDGSIKWVPSKNYSLSGIEPRKPEDCKLKGTVVRRSITKINIDYVPVELNGTWVCYYGDTINTLTDLRVTAVLGEGITGAEQGSETYNAMQFQQIGLRCNWVTAREREIGLANPTSLEGAGRYTAADIAELQKTDPALAATLKVGDDKRRYGGEATAFDLGGYQNGHLTPDMSGWYLCVSVDQYGSGAMAEEASEYIKVYSENPITVKPRTLQLLPQSMKRLYGEDNGTPTYLYDLTGLSPWDQTVEDGNGDVIFSSKGTQQELEAILAASDPGFVAPTMTVVEDLETMKPVDKRTNASNSAYYVVISGGQSSHYNFEYGMTKNGLSFSSFDGEKGYNIYTIQPRRIVVEKVNQENFGTIYADTHSLEVDWNTLKGQGKTALSPNNTLSDGATPEVVFSLPVQTESGVQYYPENGASEPVTLGGYFYADPNGDAVVNGDDIQITYELTFLPDGKAVATTDSTGAPTTLYTCNWNSFTDNYYDLANTDWVSGRRSVPVQADHIKLVNNDAAKNYVLVYKNSNAGTYGLPNDTVSRLGPTPGKTGNNYGYWTSGTGTVILRPIKTLQLTHLGKMNYTYGEIFAPNEPQSTGSSGVLTIQVTYDDLYENDAAHNVTEELVPYQVYRDAGGTVRNSFTERGFTLYYATDGKGYQGQSNGTPNQIKSGTNGLLELIDQPGTVAACDAMYNEQELIFGQYLTPKPNDGAHLFVVGSRAPTDKLIYSQVTAGRLRVDKKILTLRADNVYRFYGEENGTLTFSAAYQDLAKPDQDKLTDSDLFEEWKAAGDTTPVDKDVARVSGATLKSKLSGFQEPTLSTVATPASNVGETGVGRYNLRMPAESWKDSDNYTIRGENGYVYVFPRPIKDAGLQSDAKNPVYTVYSSVASTNFGTRIDTEPLTALVGDQFYVKVTMDTTLEVTFQDETGVSRSKTLTLDASKPALYKNPATGKSDSLRFDVTVDYKKLPETLLAEGQTEATIDADVKVTELVAKDATAYNYNFHATGTTWEGVKAAIKLRSVRDIRITGKPKMEYVYGEPLDLSGLEVTVSYAKQNTMDITDTVKVAYRGQADFEAHGLYVNYWPKMPNGSAKALPQQSDFSDGGGKSALQNYYAAIRGNVDSNKAKTGDHITIAPAHGIGGVQVDGWYLTVTAFQDGADQPATVKLVTSEVEHYYDSGTPTPIKIWPRRLTYELTATDKTYDGTTLTAGTATLTNVYQQGGITDAVFLPIGASYENGTVYSQFSSLTSQVSGGRVSFTTGTYSDTRTDKLSGNDTVTWANGAAYKPGTKSFLEFHFTNPNVHYRDESFDGGRPGVGPAAFTYRNEMGETVTGTLSDYWHESQPHNAAVAGEWDEYETVSQLPVEVFNMKILGPDAANYTWGAEKAARVDNTSVEVKTRAAAENGQARVPFATINKANRSTIRELASGTPELPTLWVDEHTNAVRIIYDQTSSGTLFNFLKTLRNNDNVAAGSVDTYRDELHYEYCLLYVDQDGVVRQWAGLDGGDAFQDTWFFGGEAVRVENDSAYQPNVEQLPQADTASENTIYKGQLYQWAQLDTGSVTVGYDAGGKAVTYTPVFPGNRTDGFKVDDAAYPGGDSAPYWYYFLYTTQRAALPRNTVFYPVVRLAETHNYNASGVITGLDADVAAAALRAVRDTDAYDLDPSAANKTAAQTSANALLALFADMTAEAQANKQARVDADAALAENGQWPTEQADADAFHRQGGSAVATYRQSLKLVSSVKALSADTTDTEQYLIKTLEAVWFTDTMVYEEQKLFDAVTYNHPTRYYGFFYDVEESAQLRFTPEEKLDLTAPFQVENVRVTLADGSTEERTIWVNENGELTVYVRITDDDGVLIRYIEIVPDKVRGFLGDEPIQLSTVTRPARHTERRLKWTSSDPSVASVDDYGLVTFQGVGTAVITVTTANGRYGTCTVVVKAAEDRVVLGEYFDPYYVGAFMELDENGYFYPTRTMTRGQLVILLDRFRKPLDIWKEDLELPYGDVATEAEYLEALKRMTAIGVITGVPGNAFEGNREATRAEFATMIARYLQLEILDTRGELHAFVDAGENETWAYAYIDALAKLGVVNGAGGGKFAPDRLITRQEVAAIIARLLTIPVDRGNGDVRAPADVQPTNWSYEAILRAVNEVDFTLSEGEEA